MKLPIWVSRVPHSNTNYVSPIYLLYLQVGHKTPSPVQRPPSKEARAPVPESSALCPQAHTFCPVTRGHHFPEGQQMLGKEPCLHAGPSVSLQSSSSYPQRRIFPIRMNTYFYQKFLENKTGDVACGRALAWHAEGLVAQSPEPIRKKKCFKKTSIEARWWRWCMPFIQHADL